MRVLPYLVFLCISAGVCSYAQDTGARNASGTPKPAGVTALEFSTPKMVEDLDAAPMTIGRFDCSDDGSIYNLMEGYALNGRTIPSGTAPNDRTALLAMHPDGSVTSFPWRAVLGFTNISLPKSVFVGNERVYVLANGESTSAKPGSLSRYPLVVAFHKDGSLADTIVLEQNLNPLVLGVFPSGKILLISEDRLNHRMALNLVSADGAPIRELRLNDSDFVVRAAQMPAAARGTSSYSTLLLLSMSKFFPSGDNLLLVPLGTSGLPIVELNERGVLYSVMPHLPDNMVLEDFVSSSESTWKVRLGSVREGDKAASDLQGKVLSVATLPSTRIVELSRMDGSLLREIEIGSGGVQPACEANGTFRFLTSSAGQGRLQVVTARER